MLTQERLKVLLHYDPHEGVFLWRKRRGIALAGSKAGHITTGGYRQIMCDGVLYQAHRLAWLYTTGFWPKNDIDHINRVRDDNRCDNLREATKKQNSENRNTRHDNSSGHTGIHWHKPRKKWLVKIGHSGKRIHIGIFTNLEDAIAARKEAERSLFTHAQL